MNKTYHAPRRPFQVEHRGAGERQKLSASKPRRWSHQDELASLVGKKVTLIFTNDSVNRVGEVYMAVDSFASGLLKAADAFTIQLELSNKSIVTYFKHSICSYNEAGQAQS